MGGSYEVKQGIFMSLSNPKFKYVGKFHAKNMAKILNGAKPRQLEQTFAGPVKVAFNLETAKRIEFGAPMVLLGVADEIYTKIEAP